MPVRDLAGFARYARNLDNVIRENTTRLVQTAAQAVLVVVAEGTPADTSLHISNWQVSIGSPRTSMIPFPIVPGRAGSSASASIAAVVGIGNSTIQSYKGGSVIHIANNGPVIESLNNGSISTGGGFFEASIDIASTIIQTQGIGIG